MATYTAAATAAMSGGLKPKPQKAARTAPVPKDPPTGRPQPAAPKAAPPRKPPAKAPTDRSAPAAAAMATGLYADPLNAITTREGQVTDVERRRLNDNLAYQKWLNATNDKQAADMQGADAQQAARSAGIQRATQAAQAVTQQTLDAQRAGRTGTVTDGPGNSRARLAGDDTLTQSLLASEQQRAASTAQSTQQKQGFLSAATAATGAANAARIRGETGTQLADLGQQRSDLLVHKEDTLSQERAAKAQAAADALKAQSDAQLAAASIDARLQIADQSVSQRASDNAASRALTAQQGAANRRTRLLTSAKGKDGKAPPVSAAEQRARAHDVTTLDNAVGAATSLAKQLKKSGTNDPDVIRAGIQQTIPGVSTEAVEAAIDSVFPVTAARRAKNQKKLATKRKSLSQGR